MPIQRKENATLRLVQLAILTAIIVVLQLTGTAIKLNFLGTSISLVLVPIVLGAMLLGAKAGAFLGFVFGVIAFVAGGVFGGDFFTYTLFQAQPFFTGLICIVKGTAAGLCAGLVYNAVLKLPKGNSLLATFLASAAAPVVNTGLFILGGLLLVSDTLNANFVAEGQTLIYFLVIGCAGINFLLELALNLVAAPAIFRVYQAFAKRITKK
ncbi:MAG: ECF transporter S component [Clostridia bacterium]|nr:ECF transporter S component [Clostridia bacterium]